MPLDTKGQAREACSEVLLERKSWQTHQSCARLADAAEQDETLAK